MSKRCRDHWDSDLPQKRIRTRNDIRPVDRLSRLSNELLLHILSFLPVSSLNVCQRLSHRFHVLGGDSEIWKRQYYSQWVRPRARRLANTRRTTLPSKTDYSPKVATWFDHGHLAQEGNWKRQYRLRHNWSKGLCRVTEVEFPRPPCPPTLVKFCAGIVFTADSAHGLRAWTTRDSACCLARVPLSTPSRSSPMTPTALAVSQIQDKIEISVGLENGHFSLFVLYLQTSQLDLQSSHVGRSDAAITAIALSSPYLMVVSQHKDLTLYNLQPGSHQPGATAESSEPLRVASLKADNMIAPMTLSLRVSSFEIVATIVYSFFHIGCGWSQGIQELRLGKDGQQLDSRLATTVDSQYGLRPLQSRKRRHSATESVDNQPPIDPGTPSIIHQQPPTSMSYSHPYLLTSHADNTLTMYLVVSTLESLFVQGGRRLWGHTSSVSAVQVTNRGKAVSVSSRGDEIRIWELEMAISSLGSRKFFEENGVQLNAGNKDGEPEPEPEPGLGPIYHSLGSVDLETQEVTVPIGFDDERVLLLRERTGTQLLECYDFT
ncbi:hypothetical protein DTO013E5_6501 [Penicillium roqueforti]|uniref:Probable E3 ubiquitin ligase complex SCF subunit sconB n=1 Tax=Penicillium roqueforti (strain FM164) TaxID=1365484 RepID=W6QGP6_PENRF|nr:uncharacterized protein LCP9604111_7494 [Penicillium roqueforti]CDM35610.1 F-box domain, cyclin-like [Penicillium roqueforti FM164]KAF9244060.1 hypothetical protein LCP9604111_7494 [Penicillium roqueforti]KAI1833716.1 hypothetical protein CBS147337_5271 [Penicillium roqueforti]KAI2670317.1 hypothetical protein CBS147355_9366 [Penicillium roqueforti]KAI2672771.1 hypothetical protein LCP963914a_9272 [Penicillium roqueforti]